MFQEQAGTGTVHGVARAAASPAEPVCCGRALVSLVCQDMGPRSAGSWGGGLKVLGCL